jgi:hypothetical protein
MMKQDLKRTQAALAHAGYLFTGYDWTGTARAAVPAAQAREALDPVADAREARRAWKRPAVDARHVATTRRATDALHERVAAWAHARVPGDPCLGAGR